MNSRYFLAGVLSLLVVTATSSAAIVSSPDAAEGIHLVPVEIVPIFGGSWPDPQAYVCYDLMLDIPDGQFTGALKVTLTQGTLYIDHDPPQYFSAPYSTDVFPGFLNGAATHFGDEGAARFEPTDVSVSWSGTDLRDGFAERVRLTFTADARGTWEAAFWEQADPGTCYTFSGVIPEPATLSLLALSGLALLRRNR